ncbi:hypothetical protein BST95_19390 (plasmid) [Halioglobus japonicus]|nr:hypothetical protein BST95_19390 [Halioglobus japonicus]
MLPVFNSRAIESNLHRIPNLSEHFLYLNDDFFLCSDMAVTDFFTPERHPCVFPTRHDMPYETQPPLSHFEHGALNACRLIERDLGYRPEKRLHHAPYALRRSTLQEIEDRYPDLVNATRARKFRHREDIPLATSMHAYYCHATGRAELRDIRCRYVDIGDPLFLLLVHPLSPLRRGKYQTCCLNEVRAMKLFGGLRDRIVVRLLDRMFN